jgi:predicted acyltransferase
LNKRDASLDALRGLTVLAMGLVNLQGSAAASFPAFVHAPWHGLTLADLVFPFFLLVVGLTIPLTHDRPPGVAWSRILRRALVLAALGIALTWIIRPSTFADLRLTGVLQRIALVYLTCAAIARVNPGAWLPAAMAAALLVLHAVALFVPAPGALAASLAPGGGLAGWLDQVALPGRALRGSYDPEGVLSTLSAVASGLIGVATARWLARRERANHFNLGVLAALLAISGIAVAFVIPLNKALWTPSFALVTAGLGLGLWALLRAAWPHLGATAAARGAAYLGRAALTLYVLQLLVIAVLVRKLPDGVRLWEQGFRQLEAWGLPPGWASLVFACVASGVCIGLLVPLQRRGWLLRA